MNKKPLYQPWSEEEFTGDVLVQKMDFMARWMYRSLLNSAFFCSTRPYLPANDEQLWILAGCESIKQWKKFKKSIMPFFFLTEIDGVKLLGQKRVLEDWQNLENIRLRNKENALKRWGREEDATALPPHNSGIRLNMQVKRSKEKVSEVKEREEMRRRTFEAICHRYGLAPDPKGYGSWSELAGICEGLGERAVESAFEEWASQHPNSAKPIAAFVKIGPKLAQKMVVVEENPRLDEFCDYASDKSDMHIIFNKLQRTEVSDLLDKYQYSDLVLAFEKFYGIIENDLYQLKFGAKDFVEKAPQILRTMQKRKEEADRAARELAEIKSREAAKGAAAANTGLLETRSEEDVLRDLGFDNGA